MKQEIINALSEYADHRITREELESKIAIDQLQDYAYVSSVLKNCPDY